MSMVFRTIASASRTLSQALAPAALLILGLVIYTGFAIPVRNMLGWSRWLNYLDPIAYGFEALMVCAFYSLALTSTPTRSLDAEPTCSVADLPPARRSTSSLDAISHVPTSSPTDRATPPPVVSSASVRLSEEFPARLSLTAMISSTRVTCITPPTSGAMLVSCLPSSVSFAPSGGLRERRRRRRQLMQSLRRSRIPLHLPRRCRVHLGSEE